MNAREDLERVLCMPQDSELLNAYRNEVRQELMDEIHEITEGTNIQWVGRTLASQLKLEQNVRAL